MFSVLESSNTKMQFMNRQKSFIITLIVLTLFALISMSFKIKPMVKAYEEFLPSEVYTVNYNFYFKGKDNKGFVKSYLPINNERQRISKVKKKSNDMTFKVKNEGENKRGVWRVNSKSRFHNINYSFVYKGKAIKYIISDGIPITKKVSDDNLKYLAEEEYIETNNKKITLLAKTLSYEAIDLKTQIKALYDYVNEIPSAPIRDLTTALTALEQNQASCNGKARLFVALCRNRGIPARLKGGIILEEIKKRTSHLWAEVYIKDRWVPFDVLNGHFAYLPANYLELYTGDHFLITHTPNILFDYNYSIKKTNHIPFINITTDDTLMNHPISLLRISESGIMPESVLYFLLLLPLGGLLIALLKNVIGLKTYGVFLPILIAYTLTSTGFLSGMFLFLIMTGLVALISLPLNKWGLLYTPKMVVILTFTILMIFMLISLGVTYKINWLTGLSFFPIIILSIMAERFARAIEEDGYQIAIGTIMQTLIATSFCYLVFASTAIKTVLLIFPEFIILIIVVTLLLGKWIGLRISEYKRFSLIIE